jgi:hypothetical protein
MPKPEGCHSSGSVREKPEACPSGIRHGGGAKLNLALRRNSLAGTLPQTPLAGGAASTAGFMRTKPMNDLSADGAPQV